MRNLFPFIVLLLAFVNLGATVQCEIHGHVIDKNKNQGFAAGMRFENSRGELVEYVTADRKGFFVILVEDTGNYNLIYYVGICRRDTLKFNITSATPSILNVDFYTVAWDYDCIPDNQGKRPMIIPRIALMQGWRSMFDASLALRFKPHKKANYESHSITVGAEWNYGFNRWLLGGKIGYTYLNECFDYSGITASVNVVYFADRRNGALYLQPQIAFEGIEFFEIISQYNIPLSSHAIDYRVNQFSAGLRIWMR